MIRNNLGKSVRSFCALEAVGLTGSAYEVSSKEELLCNSATLTRQRLKFTGNQNNMVDEPRRSATLIVQIEM